MHERSQAWWYLLVIPASWEVATEGLRFEAILGKVSMSPYLKNKLKKNKKGLGA
jgi:hypothetical protein